ncbi:MAG: shikimate kinase [bacterium]|nr:shikimate kinase [bacterium]
MKSNITLIGMPGAGKSTIGIILAKIISFGFVDTDILIQINRQNSLQNILDQQEYLKLRKIEEEEILKINIENNIIATGGSAVYSDNAMKHLSSISNVIFIGVNFENIKQRIHNFGSRGIARNKDQSFWDLYNERQVLYNKYAELIIDGNCNDQEELAEIISKKVKLL